MLRLSFSFRHASFLLFVFLVLGTLSACSSLFYYPSKLHYSDPRNAGLKSEEVSFLAPDGAKLRAWYFPPANGLKAKTLTVFFHGNAENISSHWRALAWLPAHGHSYLIFDYRGYGNSEGSPSPAGTVEDGLAALNWARAQHPDTPLVVFGQSLGGAIALRSVIEDPSKADIRLVVVESTFHSYQEVGRKVLAGGWLTWPFQWMAYLVLSDRWAPSDRLAEIAPIPLVVIHGDQDRVVPISLGRRVYSRARDPKEFRLVAGGRHIEAFWRPSEEGHREYFLAKLEAVSGSKR